MFTKTALPPTWSISSLDRAILGAVKEDGPAAIGGPVAAQERFLVLHERVHAMAEGESWKAMKMVRVIFCAAEFDQVAEARFRWLALSSFTSAGG